MISIPTYPQTRFRYTTHMEIPEDESITKTLENVRQCWVLGGGKCVFRFKTFRRFISREKATVILDNVCTCGADIVSKLENVIEMTKGSKDMECERIWVQLHNLERICAKIATNVDQLRARKNAKRV